MSVFNAANLLQTELQTDEFASEFVPIPEGVFPIQFKAPEIASGEKNGRIWARLECKARITDPNVAATMGLSPTDDLYGHYSCFLDLTEEGTLDVGVNKNVQLGILFKAIGLSGAAALTAIEGCTCLGEFKQEMSTNNRVRTVLKNVLPLE